MTDKAKDKAKRQLVIDLPEVVAAEAAPIVHVEPVINIEPPQPRAYTCRVTARDPAGFIAEFEITPQ